MQKNLPLKKRVCASCDYWDNIDRKACSKGGEIYVLAERLVRSRCVCPRNKMEKRGLMERCNEWRKWRPKAVMNVLSGARKQGSDESEIFESDIDDE